jgi:hypothetical protein
VHFLQKTEGNGEVTIHWTETGYVRGHYEPIPYHSETVNSGMNYAVRWIEAGYHEASPDLDHIEISVYDFPWWDYEGHTQKSYYPSGLGVGPNPLDYGDLTPVIQTVSVPKGIGSYTISGLTNEREYAFLVQSVDTAGNKNDPAPWIYALPQAADTKGPSYISANDITSIAGNGQVRLEWDAYNSETCTDFDHIEIKLYSGHRASSNYTYNVYTAEDYVTSLYSVTVPKGTESYTFTGLENGTGYVFLLTGFDSAGNKPQVWDWEDNVWIDYWASVVAIPEETDTTPPREGGIEPVSAGDGEATVRIAFIGGPYSDNGRYGLDFDHFELSVCLGPHTNPDGGLREMEVVKVIDNIPAPSPRVTASGTSYSILYTVTGLTNGLPYHFTLKSVDAAGNKSRGTTYIQSATIPTAEPTISATLAGLNSPVGVARYLRIKGSQLGTYYFVIYTAGAPAPNVADVAAQGTAVAKGTGAVTSLEEFLVPYTLPGPGEYTAYLVMENTNGIFSKTVHERKYITQN